MAERNYPNVESVHLYNESITINQVNLNESTTHRLRIDKDSPVRIDRHVENGSVTVHYTPKD